MMMMMMIMIMMIKGWERFDNLCAELRMPADREAFGTLRATTAIHRLCMCFVHGWKAAYFGCDATARRARSGVRVPDVVIHTRAHAWLV